MMPQKPKNSAGFTLIEVMVALSVLALGISGIAKLTQLAYQHLAVSEQYQEVAYLANNHLNSLRFQGAEQAAYQTGAYQTKPSGQPYTWELSLSPLADDVFQPTSSSLGKAVSATRANLVVSLDNGKRKLSFHKLILSEPIQ